MTVDAPPLRYGVDDAVRAGKRRQRRRRAGVVIAAVVAVAVAIGAPQITTRRAAKLPPVAPAVATTPDISYSFAGYTVGRLRVADPTNWNLAGAVAAIQKAGKPIGVLYVLRPGVEPYRPGVARTDTAPVRGRAAYFIGGGSDERWLAWEYADGAVAVVEPDVSGVTDAELRQVAEAFTPSPAGRVRVAFHAGYVTGDYKLIDAGSDPAGGLRAQATFVPAAQAAARMRQPGRGLPPDQRGQAGKVISIRVSTPSERSASEMPAKATCVDGYRPDGAAQPMGGSCGRPVAGGSYLVEVVGGVTVEQGELRKMLDAVQVADLAYPGSWPPVSVAIPASALLANY
jgi:hypothetical protein